MEIDYFTDIIAPVLGGLGIFMLGLEFMSNGIQALAVNRMRSVLGRVAGTPVKGLMAGTLITGVIQSSTAMTVMVVGLVNAGVLALRPAISVIMGANIGTTLTNVLIAMPLGTLGLFFAGIFALWMVFAKRDSTRNVMLALLGFSLIFYGLSMMTGGLKPLREMPELLSAISSLNADSYGGILRCVVTAALITALIHSSSATIGIVMGLGGAGILDWETALAFSLGADLGTTITSFIASLNLSKNAKRAAYAHISFNFIGVAVMLPLFPFVIPLIPLLIGDPGVPVTVDGEATFPLVPVAVGVYSIAFNVFNTALLFPFIGTFERVLSRVGHTLAEDKEDYSLPRFLEPKLRASGDFGQIAPAVQREIARFRHGIALFLGTAHGRADAPGDVADHHATMDILSREIRGYAAAAFGAELRPEERELAASLIEEADFSASLGDTLYQITRRVQRQPFDPAARAYVDRLLGGVEAALRTIDYEEGEARVDEAGLQRWQAELLAQRNACLADATIPADQRGALLALFGSAERAYVLIERIDAEHSSVGRLPAYSRTPIAGTEAPLPAGAPVPAE